ncbi:hypothetical protein KJ785_03695 [Patescibacteria group bacterium]|nr:hypothetical protein [Patescibacteria group bacterium]
MHYKGISAYPGKIKGKICVVHNENEFDHCEKGDVILLVRIKPSVALVKLASAVLAVHGGITSHAAIVARENNKPAVVGLPEEILEQVKNGDEVEVDAGEGVVTCHCEEPL